VTLTENKHNMSNCETKTILTHKHSDIDYLNDLIFAMTIKKKDPEIKTNYISSLNNDLKELEKL
jgi:hypothetical protein